MNIVSEVNLDLQQGGLDFWQGGLDLQQVGKIFPGGQKNVHPFICIICQIGWVQP